MNAKLRSELTAEAKAKGVTFDQMVESILEAHIASRRPSGATLKDIAKRVGKSFGLVSKVLTGETGRASVETIKKIEQIAKSMRYQPNPAAQSMGKRRKTYRAAI